ncbi:DUF6339 family protein [Streptomyces sp. NPDC003077]|uniref:DUF6339 family protein n=1 Tax=Streptomyces sp. NPDC003077 TaxID=3154443 RepID=UPI0033A9BF8C
MIGSVIDVPERLGKLSDSVANKVLTPSVMKGAALPQSTLVNGSTAAPDESSRWHTTELRALIEEAMERFAGERTTLSDSWLAPRLHSTLRLTRVEATETALWNFISLRVGPDYVRWRWGREKDGAVVVGQSARFSGRWDIQAFSRLWWAAELFRDGDNYEPVLTACANQDVMNTALRLEMMRHRPAAQAVVKLLDNQVINTGRDVNGLLKAAGAAGSTLVYEALAPDEPRDHEALRNWIAAAESDALWSAGMPQGPSDGRVPPRSVRRLAEQFEELFATAPVRGKVEPEGER